MVKVKDKVVEKGGFLYFFFNDVRSRYEFYIIVCCLQKDVKVDFVNEFLEIDLRVFEERCEFRLKRFLGINSFDVVQSLW